MEEENCNKILELFLGFVDLGFANHIRSSSGLKTILGNHMIHPKWSSLILVTAPVEYLRGK
jgi:hypothetical protein